MREVAERAQVAMSSVSRVMSGHPDVSPVMKRRVLEAVEALGYRPDLLAQGLRGGATRSVGFVISDISNPLLAQVVKGAENRLREEGYSILLSNSEGEPLLDAENVRVFTQRRVDGLIVSLASETEPATLSALDDVEGPCVLLDRDVPEMTNASVVLADHQTGMREAIGYLLSLGHRNIGLIAGPVLRPNRARIDGARAAFGQRGLSEGLEIVSGAFSAEHGERACDDLLSRPEPPTAIMAGGNQIFTGVLRSLLRRGLRIPEDISLLTCDDIELTTLMRPPIGAVSRDSVEAGRVAADLLLRRLRSPESPPETVTLKTWFAARESCAPPR
jgi:LacI family transcriptional regulator